MTPFNQIANRLNTTSKEKIVKQMGYNSIKKGLNTLDSFLTHEDLYSWLHSGHYDLKYNSKEFFEKLCEVLDISDEDIKIELEYQEALHVEMAKFKNSYIFVNTNFKRTTQPIFALAFCEHFRKFKPPVKELVFKTDIEILEVISNSVQNHYKSSKGEIGIWGKVVNYVFHLNEENTYLYSIDGIIKKPTTIDESKAELFLNNKKLLG